MKRLPTLIILFAGLTLSAVSAILWLCPPPRETLAGAQTVILKGLECLDHLRAQIHALPATLQAARASLQSAASGIDGLHTTLHTAADEGIRSPAVLKDNATLIAAFGDRARAMADTTANYMLPLPEASRGEFHRLRGTLYQADGVLQTSATHLRDASDMLGPELVRNTRSLHRTLDHTTAALRLCEQQVRSLETGLVPQFAAWLDSVAAVLQTIPAWISWAKRVTALLLLLGLATGLITAGTALWSLLSSSR